MAQARLPIFYRSYGVLDTADGSSLFCRSTSLPFSTASPGAGARDTIHALVDRLSTDMETVLRELGIGDLAIPKKVRGLAASTHGLLYTYAAALEAGQEALAAALGPPAARAASEPLASYVWGIVRAAADSSDARPGSS